MTRPRFNRALATLAAVPTMFVGTACYEFHPTEVSVLRRDETVHVDLSPAASASLASTFGPNATALDGRVLSVESGVLRLAVTQIARATGPEEFMQGEPADLPVGGASAITVRSVDTGRSILALGGIVFAALAARLATDQAGVLVVKGGQPAGTK